MRYLFLFYFSLACCVAPKESLEAWRKKENVCGIAAAIVTPKGTEVITLGNTGRHTRVSVKEETFFRLGRLTQIFTYELAREVLQGEFATFFPKGIRFPKKEGKELTLDHLLTHTSGLQGVLPPCFNEKTASASILLSHCGKGKLQSTPGTRRVDLDLNYALLSVAIRHKTLQTFTDAMQEKIMPNYPHLRFELTLPERQKLAQGNNGIRMELKEGVPAYSPFAAARGLYGTITDLKLWLEKVAKGEKDLPPHSNGSAGPFVVNGLSGNLALRTYFIADQYLGHSLFLAYVPMTKMGIALIANTDLSVEALGREILASINSAEL